MSEDANMEALAAWKKNGGPRPITNPDGILTRIVELWMTDAERAIRDAALAVEKLGASEELTEARRHLLEANHCVANHVEKKPPPSGACRDDAAMNERTFVLVSNFYDVVNGIEDEPERILLPLDRIEMGLVFVHNGTTMVRLSIADLDTDVTVDLEKLMKATGASVRWISAE